MTLTTVAVAFLLIAAVAFLLLGRAIKKSEADFKKSTAELFLRNEELKEWMYNRLEKLVVTHVGSRLKEHRYVLLTLKNDQGFVYESCLRVPVELMVVGVQVESLVEVLSVELLGPGFQIGEVVIGNVSVFMPGERRPALRSFSLPPSTVAQPGVAIKIALTQASF